MACLHRFPAQLIHSRRLARRFCVDCERFRRIKDYTERKIRTVFGCVDVSNSCIPELQTLLAAFL